MKLKRDAEAYWATRLPAIVTVPAYFNDAQRQATKKPARSPARVLRIINEPPPRRLPTASTSRPTRPSFVFDLGVGLRRVLLEIGDGVFGGQGHLRVTPTRW